MRSARGSSSVNEFAKAARLSLAKAARLSPFAPFPAIAAACASAARVRVVAML